MTSMDVFLVKLESAELSKLYNNSTNSSSNDSGVSFDSLLAGAISDNTGINNVLTNNDISSNNTADGNMSVSDSMVKFIENKEGFSANSYSGVDSWNQTTGYGHVIKQGENLGNVTLTQKGAENLLRSDLKSCEDSVNKEFKGVNLTQNQFDALVSFSYNLGTNIWSKAPKLTSDIKAGASPSVLKDDFLNCSYCGGKIVQGLVNRRLDEWQVYTNGEYPFSK